jgi:hypothetical protein
VTKEQCAELYGKTSVKCAQILLGSDPFDFKFPPASLPAACKSLEQGFQQPGFGGESTAESTAEIAQLQANCTQAAAPGQKSYAEIKAATSSLYNQCVKLGVDPTAGLSTTDAAAVKAVMGAGGGAAGLAASVVLAAAAVLMAF